MPVAEPAGVLEPARLASSRSRRRRRGSACCGRASSSGRAAHVPRAARVAASAAARRGDGCVDGDDRVAALAQPHVPLRPRHARIAGGRSSRIRRSSSSAASSSEPSHPPLDPLGRGDRRLDRRPLPVAAEVRAQARPQVARAADVEHLVVAAEEEVDAGAGRRAEREVALVEQPPRSRRRERREVGDRARAAFLREADQREQQLGGRAGVRERAVARPLARVEKPRELAETEAGTRPASSVRASRTVSTTGEPMRMPVRRSVSRSRKARSKRALCATRTASPAKARKRRTASAGRGAPRSCAVRARSSRSRPASIGSPGSTSVSNSAVDLEAAHAHRPDLADLRRARAAARSSRGRRRRTSRPRAGGPRRAAAASATASPLHASRASVSTTSARSVRARATGACRSAKSRRAASSASTGPRCSSTSSTSRSAASSLSCMTESLGEHTFARQLAPLRAEPCRRSRAGHAGAAGRAVAGARGERRVGSRGDRVRVSGLGAAGKTSAASPTRLARAARSRSGRRTLARCSGRPTSGAG